MVCDGLLGVGAGVVLPGPCVVGGFGFAITTGGGCCGWDGCVVVGGGGLTCTPGGGPCGAGWAVVGGGCEGGGPDGDDCT